MFLLDLVNVENFCFRNDLRSGAPKNHLRLITVERVELFGSMTCEEMGEREIIRCFYGERGHQHLVAIQLLVSWFSALSHLMLNTVCLSTSLLLCEIQIKNQGAVRMLKSSET